MQLDFTPANRSDVKKSEIEQVQQEKQEYKLIGSFLRTRGLTLFGYNHIDDYVFKVDIKYGNTIHLIPIDGKLIPIDLEAEKCVVDARFEYFEALKYKTATERVKKYKEGKIKTLCNLRKPNLESIKLF